MAPSPYDQTRALSELMLEALRRKNAVFNKLGANALVVIGKPIVPLLMFEAVATKKPGYRARLLRVVARIGEPLELEQHLQLFAMLTDTNSEVREAARAAVFNVGPPGQRERAKLEEVAQSNLSDGINLLPTPHDLTEDVPAEA
jgi:hypothetical protein